MSTTTMPTADELRAEIEAHEQTIAECEREIGALTLDGRTSADPTRRARDARLAIERIEAALAELVRREQADDEERRRGAASVRRREAYLWAAEQARRLIALVEAQLKVKEAEEHLASWRGAPGSQKVRYAQNPVREMGTAGSDLDADVLVAVPETPGEDNVGPAVLRARIERWTAAADLAERRAAAEACGEGADLSGVESTRSRERREARMRQRAAAGSSFG